MTVSRPCYHSRAVLRLVQKYKNENALETEGSPMDVPQQLIDYFMKHAGVAVTEDTLLVEENVIDSMGVLELIEFMETSFTIAFEMDDLTIENFATIKDITNLIKDKTGE